MGMFDIINAKLECLEKKEINEREIQIKWRDFRLLEHFKTGDKIEELWLQYNNTWIRANYLCDSCSKKTKGKNFDYIKTEDQKWHYCFVKIENKKIASVLAEKEFLKLGIENYIRYD
jgi:hypothetical protein